MRAAASRARRQPAHAEPARGETLSRVREAAAGCRDCPLWKNATQTVFGAGAARARIILVGEQPGDREDREGEPFVGPAGLLLNRALEEAGIDRTATYVTNAVKHFKFELRGKRRIHKKPVELEISACRQWLEREARVIRPHLIVVLGATAARAVFGRATAIERNRGRVLPADAALAPFDSDLLVTVHPSFLLRMPEEDKPDAFRRFVADLKLARPYLA